MFSALPKPVSASTSSGRLTTSAIAATWDAISLNVVSPMSGAPRYMLAMPAPVTYTTSKPVSSITRANRPLAAPGNSTASRRARLALRAAVRFTARSRCFRSLLHPFVVLGPAIGGRRIATTRIVDSQQRSAIIATGAYVTGRRAGGAWAQWLRWLSRVGYGESPSCGAGRLQRRRCAERRLGSPEGRRHGSVLQRSPDRPARTRGPPARIRGRGDRARTHAVPTRAHGGASGPAAADRDRPGELVDRFRLCGRARDHGLRHRSGSDLYAGADPWSAACARPAHRRRGSCRACRRLAGRRRLQPQRQDPRPCRPRARRPHGRDAGEAVRNERRRLEPEPDR